MDSRLITDLIVEECGEILGGGLGYYLILSTRRHRLESTNHISYWNVVQWWGQSGIFERSKSDVK